MIHNNKAVNIDVIVKGIRKVKITLEVSNDQRAASLDRKNFCDPI